MKKLNIYDLVLEVGRFCDQECEHCLRGERSKIRMSKQTITKTLEQIESIDVLTFTGGEPFLYVKTIRFILDELKRLNISVNRFFISTNGQHLNAEILGLIYDLHCYSEEEYSSECLTMIRVSADQFHKDIDAKKLEFWKSLDFVNVDTHIEPRYLYQECYAAEYYETCRFPSDQDLEFEGNSVNGMVYINALGQVLLDCDYSYKSQRTKHVGCLKAESLCDILLRSANANHACNLLETHKPAA